MYSKNISILCSQSQFSPFQLERLASLGEVIFLDSLSLKCPKDSEVLVFDPNMVGGVVKAKNRLPQLLGSAPGIKYSLLPHNY
jgi:hypothetical protein